MTRHRTILPILTLSAIALVAPPAAADETPVPASDDHVTWMGGPCTEPVLMVETDRENVRRHIPSAYPGTADEFMSHVVPSVGADGRLKATLVFTLNRCTSNTITKTVNGVAQPSSSATDVSEVLVMVLFDGASNNAFEFYAFASYIDDPTLATAFRSLGLPAQHTSGLVYQLDANPEQPAPGATVPFAVEVPGVFRVSGSAVRPLTYGPAGHATHHYHGARGAVWSEHDAPTGGLSTSSATITVTGPAGAWLADLLGRSSARATGLLLEKLPGHGHTAYLVK